MKAKPLQSIVICICFAWLSFAEISLCIAVPRLRQGKRIPPHTPPVAANHRRRALLIGISKYQRPGGPAKFDNLDTLQDVRMIRDVLIGKFKFLPTEIKTLTTPEETTRNVLVNTIQSYLIESAKSGDILFLFYSGHGSVAPNPDDPSGYDQTLVPTDYWEDGSRDIRDKQIKAWLDDLKANHHPANVTLVFDCCHAATLDRGQKGHVRGLGWKQRFPNLPPKPQDAPGKHPLLTGDLTGNSGFVSIAACQDDEEALDMDDGHGDRIGRLTFLLSKALNESGPETTYQALFDRVEAQMAQRFPDEQTPHIEGDSNQQILSGIAESLPRYTPVYFDGEHVLRIRAGLVQGITPGSRFAVYPSGTTRFLSSLKLAEGQIKDVGAWSSRFNLTYRKPQLTSAQLEGAEAVETLHVYGDNRVTIRMKSVETLPNSKPILAALRQFPFVNTAPEAGRLEDVRIAWADRQEAAGSNISALEDTPGPGRVPLLVRAETGSVLALLNTSEDVVAQLKSLLRRESIYRTVRLLHNEVPNGSVRVEMRLVPAQVTQEITPRGKEDVWGADLPVNTGGADFIPDTWITVEVRNVGTEDAWIQVLDLQSDGSVSQLWPPVDAFGLPKLPVTTKLARGHTQWQKLWKRDFKQPWPFHITRPLGTEIFKLVATLSPVNLTGVTTKRDAQTPLQFLLRASRNGLRDPSTVVPIDWCTATATFKVREAENQP